MPNRKKVTLKTYLLTGFLAILPLLITWFVLGILVSLLVRHVGPVSEAVLSLALPKETLVRLDAWYVPTILGSVAMVVIIFFIGVATQMFIGRLVFSVMEGVIRHIPLVNAIYDGVHQVVSAFSVQGDAKLRQVVLARITPGGAYALGFLTAEVAAPNPSWGRKKAALVYVPSNQLYLGHTFLVDLKDVVPLDMTVEQGMKLVVTAGLAVPPGFARPSKRKS